MRRSLFEIDWIERTPLRAIFEPHAGKNRYVHFTDVAKIGINPNKRHDDPHGVYCYAVDHILDQGEADRYLRHGETFAVQRDFYYIIEPAVTHGILDLSSISEDAVTELAQRNDWLPLWKQALRKAGASWIETAGDLMWNTLKRNTHGRPWGLKWSDTLRDINIILDPYGVIHPAEPGAAVFLNPRSYRVVAHGENPDKSGGNSFTLGYWKEVILRVWSKVAGTYAGRVYWNKQMPHVDFTMEGVKLTAVMSPVGSIHIRYPKEGEIAEYRVDEIDLDEVSEQVFYDEFIVTAGALARASKMWD